MTSIAEVEKLAMELPDGDRALLAEHLLQSLPAILDEGDAAGPEAVQDAADFESELDIGISLEQLGEGAKPRREKI